MSTTEETIALIANIEKKPSEPYEQYEAKIVNAIKVLGERRAVEAVKPLVDLFGTENDFFCEAAVEALVEIGEPAVGALAEYLSDKTRGAGRNYAVDTLAEIGTERSIRALISVMKEGDLVDVTAKALIKAGDPKTIDLLEEVVSDREANPLVVSAAKHVIGEIKRQKVSV